MDERQAPPPQQQVMQLLTAKMAGQALTQIAELGIADLLKDGPRSAAQLAEASGSNADALYRVLRALVAVGYFVEHPGRSFANNALSEVLRSDVPGSVRAMARWLGDEESWWTLWGHLGKCIRTGKPATEVAMNMGTFEFLGSKKRSLAIFQDAMTSFSAVTSQAVVEAYDFSGVERIVDVGGGHGFLLSTILKAVPSARGVLFDLPEVLAGAAENLGRLGQAARIETVAGSFLEGVPGDADTYIMKHIIHDWDDARSRQILQNCKKGLRKGGRILIVEGVITDRPESTLGKLIDIEMLVVTSGGRERTEPEFAELARSAGLSVTRVVPTQSPVCVIELRA